MSNTYADMFIASAMIMSLLWLRNLFIVDAFLRKFRIVECFLKFSIHYIEVVCFPSTHVSSKRRHKIEE